MADSAGMNEQFRLVDLDIIKRYSLAVRQESAPAEEILEALEASRQAVLSALGLPPPGRRRGSRRRPAAEGPGPPAAG
ncbi:MAG: hypothetical protein KY458_04920 [Actinobacteria bacterium]|nr:hypothetical protein [Actinomycetota bacterium]